MKPTEQHVAHADLAQAPLPAIREPEPTSLMAVIARVASDPNADIGKMERLLEMHERLTARQAEQAFNSAMTEVQIMTRPVAADANNPQTKSKYASHLALDRALRPIYTAHGFALSFDTGDGVTEGYVRVLCYLSHKEGHSRTYHVDMPADGKGAKGGDVMTKTHATGAAYSYGARYLLKLIFNIAVGEDDSDGNDPVSIGPITDIQLEHIQTLIDRSGADVEKFTKFMGVDCLKNIMARDYDKAIRALNLKAREAKKP